MFSALMKFVLCLLQLYSNIVCMGRVLSNSTFLGNCLPTSPLGQHFAQSEK